MSTHTHDPVAEAKVQEATHNFVFRDATMEDIPALQKMIGESMRGLGKGYYSQGELDGSIGWLFGPDTLLLRVSPCLYAHWRLLPSQRPWVSRAPLSLRVPGLSRLQINRRDLSSAPLLRYSVKVTIVLILLGPYLLHPLPCFLS